MFLPRSHGQFHTPIEMMIPCSKLSMSSHPRLCPSAPDIDSWPLTIENRDVKRKDNQSLGIPFLPPLTQLHHFQNGTQPTSTPTKCQDYTLHPHQFLVRLFYMREVLDYDSMLSFC